MRFAEIIRHPITFPTNLSEGELLHKIQFEDPTPVRKIDPRIPKDLETILMRSMMKRPADRYESAEAMADDLRRFAEGKPIREKRPTLLERVRYWGRAHRQAAAVLLAMTAMSFLAAIGMAIVFFAMFSTTQDALAAETEQKAEVLRQKSEVEEKKNSLQLELRRSRSLRLARDSTLQIESDPMRSLLLSIAGGEQNVDVDTNDAMLDAIDSLHEVRTLSGHTTPIGSASFNPTGDRLVCTTKRSLFNEGPTGAFVWDIDSGKLLHELCLANATTSITSAVYSPDAQHILTTGSPPPKEATDDVDGKLVGQPPRLWHDMTRQDRGSFENAFLFETHDAIFSPKGDRLVLPTLGHSATIFDFTGHAAPNVLRLMHDKRVVFAAYSPNGERVVTTSDDNTVRIWDATTGELQWAFDLWKQKDSEAAECTVDRVEFRLDGRQLVTASQKHGVHLWDLETGRQVNSEIIAGANCTYWSDGLRLLTHGKYGNSLTIRNVVDGTPIRSFQHEAALINRVRPSPDGQWIATHHLGRSAEISLWNAKRGQIEVVFRGHQAMVHDFAFSKDSSLLATASEDKSVRIWNLKSGLERATYQSQIFQSKLIFGSSPDGKRLAIARSGTIPGGRLLKWGENGNHTEIDGQIWMFDGAGAESLLATRGDEASVYTVGDGSLASSIRLSGNSVAHAAIDRTGKRVAVFDGGQLITLWLVDQQRRVALMVGDTQINHLCFDRMGKRLAAVSSDGLLRVWDADSGTQIASLRNSTNVIHAAFLPNNSSVVAVVGDHNSVRVWDVDERRLMRTLHSPTATFRRCLFSADGKRLLTHRQVNAEAVHVWDTGSGDLLDQVNVKGNTHVAIHPTRNEALITSEAGAVVWQFDAQQHRAVTDESVDQGVYSNDGKQFFTTSTVRLPDRVWKRAAATAAIPRSRLQRWSAEDLSALGETEFEAAHPRKLFAAGNDGLVVHLTYRFGIANHSVATHREVNTIAGHQGPISSCIFTSDSKSLITSSWDRSIVMWDAATGRREKTLRGHVAAVYCAAITTDDRLLASGSKDGECIVWNLETGEAQQRIKLGDEPIHHVAFHPAESRLLALCRDGTLIIYDLVAKRSINLGISRPVAWAEYSSNGAQLLVLPLHGERPGTPPHFVWIVPSNGTAVTKIEHGSEIKSAHFHPRRGEILTATSAGEVSLRHATTGEILHKYPIHGLKLRAAVFDNSGKHLAAIGASRTSLFLVDTATEWYSVDGVMSPLPLHDHRPFFGDRVLTLRDDVARYRDWPLDVLGYAKTQTSREFTPSETSRFRTAHQSP